MLSEQAAANGHYAVGDEITVHAACAAQADNEPAAAVPPGICTETVPVGGHHVRLLAADGLPPSIPPDRQSRSSGRTLAKLEGTSLEGKPVERLLCAVYRQRLPARAKSITLNRENINETLVDHGITASVTNIGRNRGHGVAGDSEHRDRAEHGLRDHGGGRRNWPDYHAVDCCVRASEKRIGVMRSVGRNPDDYRAVPGGRAAGGRAGVESWPRRSA